MRLVTAVLAALALHPSVAMAGDLPLLGDETPRGGGRAVALAPVAPGPFVLDGDPSDWRGSGPAIAGTVVRSRGELIYTDHLFDSHGADDGGDARRLAAVAPAQAALPGLYRFDAIAQNDPAGQFGLPMPEDLQIRKEHGDLGLQDEADLVELRASSADGALWLLARTTTMAAAGDARLLVLLDTAAGDASREVGFGTGLRTAKAELALLVEGERARLADLRDGSVRELPGAVAVDPSGFVNAIEARLDLGLPAVVGLAAVTLAPGGAPANVAFRTAEPVREYFDRDQALALHAGSIDEFFAATDLAALQAGANQRWEPGPGYHEATFRSAESISTESGDDGVHQRYGLYLPRERWNPSPLQLWLHWRGGDAHAAGNVIPSMFRDLGEERHAIVVSPGGRGSSGWYVGKSHVDVMEVWDDVHARFAINENRRYVSGHSMGGWGSYLFSVAHPDWFAGSLPASPPATQGAWTGLDFEGCDELRFDEYSPCYIEANGGQARVQNVKRLLGNVLHVPQAVQHGTADELVPTSGVLATQAELVKLGYRHRVYLFHTQEHFGPPLWDQWRDTGRWAHSFRRPERPARVRFTRDMPFERAIERDLDLDFDRAYWLSGLEPADERDGVASFDGRSHAIYDKPQLALLQAWAPLAPGQAGPYTMSGMRWVDQSLALAPPRSNAFTITVTGARAATLDTVAMQLDRSKPIVATVTTDTPLALTLAGGGAPRTVGVPTGSRRLVVSP